MLDSIPTQDWIKAKGEIQKIWTGLNADELEQTHGDVSALSTLVHDRYGISQDEAQKKIEEVVSFNASHRGTSESDLSFEKSKMDNEGATPPNTPSGK